MLARAQNAHDTAGISAGSTEQPTSARSWSPSRSLFSTAKIPSCVTHDLYPGSRNMQAGNMRDAFTPTIGIAQICCAREPINSLFPNTLLVTPYSRILCGLQPAPQARKCRNRNTLLTRYPKKKFTALQHVEGGCKLSVVSSGASNPLLFGV